MRIRSRAAQREPQLALRHRKEIYQHLLQIGATLERAQGEQARGNFEGTNRLIWAVLGCKSPQDSWFNVAQILTSQILPNSLEDQLVTRFF